MTVRVNKQSFNIREKLSELERPIGLKGSELMGSESVQEARDLISAGRKNLFINGDMRIAQRSNSASTSNNTYNTLDRYNTWINYGSGGVTMSQSSDAPPGFYKCLQFYNDGNATSPSYHFVEQKIEAQNISRLKMGTSDAEYMTLSFWVRSNRTGTFNIEILDDDGSHHIVKRYTINNAATWEYKTITFPPATNTGVPTYDNTIGLYVEWWIVSSGSYRGTSTNGTWQTFSTTRRNDGGNTTFESLDYWQVTGIQLEVGKNATDFEHRSIGEELALCQRYYYEYPKGNTYNIIANGLANTSNNSLFHFQFPVPMRAAPVVATTGSWQVIDGTSHTISSFSAITDATELTARVDATTINSNLTAGKATMLRNNNDANARFAFNAEL